MSTPIKRKLAAILSADVAGYSQLMEADEEGTLRLLAAHRAIIDSIIGFHDGRVVNTAGDSVLAEFGSPVEAVRAASKIQEALKTRNESLPERSRMVFRIGVNLGDVMIKGDDLLGDGVNVAARLQALAEPGGICISGSVFDQIDGKLSLHFQDIGEQTLKNITRPVRALHLRGTAPKGPLRAPATPVRRRGRRGVTAALVGAGLIVLAGAVYLGGLLVSARQAVETERVAAERARSQAEAVRVEAEGEATRLRAETDAVRLKAEAEATKARAETERRKAEEERAAAAQARAEAEAARTTAAAARPTSPGPAATVAVTPPGNRESRFDGVWAGQLSCPDWRGVPAMLRPQRAVVRNGEMTLDMPLPARARTIQAVGKIRDDDSIEVRAPGFGPEGRVLQRVIKGRFVHDSFTAEVEPPGRPCSLQLSREAAASRPGG